ncbi:MAG: hypothetical protein Kow0042_01430 [Calditrichia bacterium]
MDRKLPKSLRVIMTVLFNRELSEQDLQFLVSLLPEEFTKLARDFQQSVASRGTFDETG